MCRASLRPFFPVPRPMLTLRCVILLHIRRGERHWDWLMDDPDPLAPAPAAPLWAARCDRPPHLWAAPHAAAMLLTPLPPHRRRYLTYQGPLTDGRGTVVRVAEGHARPLLWSASRRIVTLTLHGMAPLTLDLTRLTPDRWRAA